MTEKPVRFPNKGEKNPMALSRAMSSGVAGLKAFQTAMDVIGNNISNVNTYGFKASRTTFSDTLYQTLQAASGDNGARAGSNAVQVGYGSSASAIQMDTGISGMSSTGYNTDCYINGQGYFVTATGYDKDAKKPTGLQYTRVGELQFDSTGNLTDGKNYVLGVMSTDGKTVSDLSASNTPTLITCDPTTYSNPSIAADGTITATKTADGTITTIGKVALAHFTNPSGLTQEGGSYYKDSDNSGAPAYDFPGAGGTGSLVTGNLEASNVDLANEFSNMIQTERGYQANSKMISVGDDMMETLVNMVR